MRYLLVRQGVEALEPALICYFDSEFKATEWARSWLRAHAQHDRYLLTQDNNPRSILMLRTVADQWYAIPLTQENAPHRA